jgi:hypothetical protein
LNIIDGELIKFTDLEMDMSSQKNNVEARIINNPDKALIRYQFMEMFFRIANDKYIRSNICKSYADAYYMLMNEINGKFTHFD